MNYIIHSPSKIGVYVQTKNCKAIKQVKQEIGASAICNFQMFNLSTLKASFVLKVDGKIWGNDGTNYWGYGWNKNDTKLSFDTANHISKYDNFAACILVAKDSKAITKPSYPAAIGGVRGRTCIGRKANGDIVIYCWKDGTRGACRLEALGQKMIALGCIDAIAFDGGGSTQLSCPDGDVLTSRVIYNFFYVTMQDSKDKPTVDVDECPYIEPNVLIRRGSRGDGVKWLQWQLNKWGAKLAVDGIFGNGTQAALTSFQKDAGLVIDGICGNATRKALLSRSNAAQNTEDKSIYIQTLKNKRNQMLDYIEKRVGDLYVYGSQGQLASDSIINWSKRCFPAYTTDARAKRMKQYVRDVKKNPQGETLRCYDCSGLFWAAENEVELPLASYDVDDSTAAALYNQYCIHIKKSELRPLDLVFNTALTHMAVVGRDGKIYEAAGSDIGVVVNDSVDDRIVQSIYGKKYGTAEKYQKDPWTKFGRLKIYENILD